MTEALTKATHDVGFVETDLRAALNKASNVEALIVLDLIKAAADLRIKTEALLNARVADKNS